MKIGDFKLSFNTVESAMKATQLFELRKNIQLSVMSGHYRQARTYQKVLAKNAVDSFDVYKKLPFLRFSTPGMSLKDTLSMAFKNWKFKLFCKFSKKTPEEKQFRIMCKEYYGNLTPEEIKNNTIDITIPAWTRYI